MEKINFNYSLKIILTPTKKIKSANVNGKSLKRHQTNAMEGTLLPKERQKQHRLHKVWF